MHSLHLKAHLLNNNTKRGLVFSQNIKNIKFSFSIIKKQFMFCLWVSVSRPLLRIYTNFLRDTLYCEWQDKASRASPWNVSLIFIYSSRQKMKCCLIQEKPWRHWARPRIHAERRIHYASITVFLFERVRKHASCTLDKYTPYSGIRTDATVVLEVGQSIDLTTSRLQDS